MRRREPPAPLYIRSAINRVIRRYSDTVRVLLLIAFVAGLVVGSLLTAIVGI